MSLVVGIENLLVLFNQKAGKTPRNRNTYIEKHITKPFVTAGGRFFCQFQSFSN